VKAVAAGQVASATHTATDENLIVSVVSDTDGVMRCDPFMSELSEKRKATLLQFSTTTSTMYKLAR